MSYYLADYFTNVPAYTASDEHLPVTGWGLDPQAAGPARIGVGAAAFQRVARTTKRIAFPGSTVFTPAVSASVQPPPAAAEGSEGWPWWIYMAVPLFLGGGLLFAADMGWLGGKAQEVAAGGKP
jgi:hypothetical protein